MVRRIFAACLLGCALLLASPPAGAATGGKKSTGKAATRGKKTGAPGKRAARKTTTSLSGSRAGRRLRASANGLDVEASQNALVDLTASWKPSASGDGRPFGRMEIVIADTGKGARGRRNTGATPAAISLGLRGVDTSHRQFTGGTGQSANSIHYGFRARRVTSKVERDDTALEIAQKLATNVNGLRREDGVAYYSAQARSQAGRVTLTIWPGGALQ